MSLSKIIALDLGKFKTVCCVMDAATRESAFETVQTSPVSLHELIVKQLPPSPADALVVFETCDLAGWVHDLCQGLGVRVIVTHANGEAWQWRRVKRKTDRDDALKLAKLALLDQLGPVHMPSPDQRQRRRLVLHRRLATLSPVPRTARSIAAGGFYHVLNRGNGRQAIFHKDADYGAFLPTRPPGEGGEGGESLGREPFLACSASHFSVYGPETDGGQKSGCNFPRRI
ncbi:IS110 family transposase [Humisphaera borealis]|uniref:Transposase n=1 Tax=Humisphaera borealis TaxID=2807512 RepID=A0A7M2WQJ7_9BACT|nr:transposase [Humisphaera borealis]QOV87683.1 transposase [Humisphaera borealis]